MGLLHRSLLVIASLAVLVSGSAAGSFIGQETITGLDGTEQTRTITSSDDAVSGGTINPVITGTRGANQYLWLDTNHMDAIPEHVAITGDGELGLVGWWLNSKRVSLYQVRSGIGFPNWTHPMPHADLQIAVDADFSGDRLATTAQGESLYVFDEGSSNPVFSDWFAPPYVGMKCSVSDDGTTSAGGGGNPSGLGGEIRVYDGTTGALRFARSLPAKPEGVCVSGDGLVVSANTRGIVKVWDAITGALRDSVAIPGETETPAVLSEDGSYLVTGGFTETVRLYSWNGSDYVEDWASTIDNTSRITALAISRDGSSIVAGTWTDPTGGQVVVYNRTGPIPIWTDTSFGDLVQSVAVSSDGQKIAAGSWGRMGETVGNVISVYERDSPIPLWTIGDDAIAGVGSCMSVALDESGYLLLAGGKSVHAREFGSGGFVIAIDVTSASGVADVDGVSVFAVGPNPFSRALRTSGAFEGVSIWSADGRLIRSVLGSLWDGRDEAGREVPAGVYFLRDTASRAELLRVVRLR